MTKEEKEIAMAACCVGTICDAYEGTEDFDRMVMLRVDHLIELVRDYLSKQHTQGLDKAADQYASDNASDYPDVAWEDTFDDAKFAFVAGAKYQRSKDLVIVQNNTDRAAKCMEQSTGFEEYPYWDGAHDMANAIRREIEMEE